MWCPILRRSELITHDLQPEREFARNASSCSLEHSDPMRAAICCDWCLDERWSRVRDIHSSSAEFWLNSIEQLWTILNTFNHGKKILKFSGIGHLRSWNHVSAWNVCCSAVCKLADSDVQKNAINRPVWVVAYPKAQEGPPTIQTGTDIHWSYPALEPWKCQWQALNSRTWRNT